MHILLQNLKLLGDIHHRLYHIKHFNPWQYGVSLDAMHSFSVELRQNFYWLRDHDAMLEHDALPSLTVALQAQHGLVSSDVHIISYEHQTLLYTGL